MTLQQLEYLLALSRTRHFGRAAEECDVTQPTLSAMISKLEDELEAKLFDRKQTPLGITPIGEAVVAQAEVVLRESEKLLGTVRESQGSLTGTFHIGILPTIAPYLLPRFFPQMMREHPELDIRITEMKSPRIKEALLRGEIDAGIMADIGTTDGFGITELFYEQYFAYVSERDELFKVNRIKSSDLAGKSLWLLEEGHCFRDQLVRFCQIKEASASQRAYHLGSIETFMRMVEGGRGVTFIPELAIDQLSQEQKRLVRPFAIPVPTREIMMVTHPHFIRTRLRDFLVEKICKCLPKEMLSPHRQNSVLLR